MITQTTPAGISIGPIDGPRVNTGIAVQPISIQPIFTGQNQQLARIRQEEVIYTKRQAERTLLLEQQQAALNAAMGAGGKGKVGGANGLDVDSSTKIGRDAINFYNETTSNFLQQQTDVVQRATGKNGKIDMTSAQRDLARLTNDYQFEVTNNESIIKASKAQIQKKAFEKDLKIYQDDKTQFVAMGRAREAVEQWRAAQDDPNITFDSKVFNAQNYAYNQEAVQKDLDELMVLAINETTLVEQITAAELGGGFESTDGVVLRESEVRNERDKAIKIGNSILADNPRLRQALKDQQFNPDTYVEEKVKAKIAEDQKRIVLKKLTGLDDAMDIMKQRQKSDADLERKQTTSKFESTATRGFSEDEDGYETKVGYKEELNRLDNKFRATATQVREIYEFLQSDEGSAYSLSGNVRITPDGEIKIVDVAADGKETEVRTYGKASETITFEGALNTYDNLTPGFNDNLLPQKKDRSPGMSNAGFYTNNYGNYKAPKSSGLALHSEHDYNGDGNYHIIFGSMEESIAYGAKDWEAKLFGNSWVDLDMTLDRVYRGGSEGASPRYAETATRGNTETVAKALGVSPDITMADLREQKTPEEIIIALGSVENPEIYKARINGEIIGGETSSNPAVDALLDPNTPNPASGSTTETGPASWTRSKDEYHTGVGEMLEKAYFDGGEVVAGKVTIDISLRPQIREYQEINRQLKRSPKGKELVRLEKKRDELFKNLLENDDVRKSYFETTLPKEAVNKEIINDLYTGALGLQEGETFEVNIPYKGFIDSSADIEITKYGEEFIIDVDNLGLNDQFRGTDLTTLIGQVVVDSDYSGNVDQLDRAMSAYMAQNTGVDQPAATGEPIPKGQAVNLNNAQQAVVTKLKAKPAFMKLDDGQIVALIKSFEEGNLTVEQNADFKDISMDDIDLFSGISSETDPAQGGKPKADVGGLSGGF
jgi:hypothetical protein